MRIIHTSDWHLGQHFYGKSRAAEHSAFLTWLLAQVEEKEVDAVIVAGDIFDTGTPPSYARELYFDFVVKLNQIKCELVVLAGNHDSVAMLGESKGLLAKLSTRVVPIASHDQSIHQQVFTLKNRQGQDAAVICAIPFIRPRDILQSKAGQSAGDKQQSLQQAIADHYQSLYLSAKELANKDPSDKTLPIIATGHLTTVGVSVSDSVRDIYIGTLDAFPANAFPPADYIALGHIHRSQKVAKSDVIRYCGSPIPLSFDEAKYDKSVLMVEFDEMPKTTVAPITIPRFQPMLMVKAPLDNIYNEVENAIAALGSNDEKAIWLDIEIESAEYLDDLQARITQIVDDLPVEILLVRRSKQSRKLMSGSQEKITLKELSLEEVFDARLSQESLDTEEEIARKPRLSQLFRQAVERVQNPEMAEKEVTEIEAVSQEEQAGENS